MKYLIFVCLGVFISLGLSSCSSYEDIEKKNVLINQSLSLKNSILFKNVLDSINAVNAPYIRRGKTRAANAPDSVIAIFSPDEKQIIEKNETKNA